MHTLDERHWALRMESSQRPQTDEVDLLLRNAELRDQLEPFLDESILCINSRALSLRDENEFLASMLAWERAPAIPISQWFEPELQLPDPRSLSDDQLRQVLHATLEKLAEKRILLVHTDHLSDRELYQVILRDILPSYEKRLECPTASLRWDCADPVDNTDTWLRYYASQEQREAWSQSEGRTPPPRELPQWPRLLPGDES